MFDSLHGLKTDEISTEGAHNDFRSSDTSPIHFNGVVGKKKKQVEYGFEVKRSYLYPYISEDSRMYRPYSILFCGTN